MATREPREGLTNDIESVLRSRTYDEHACDEETFEELLDDIDVLVWQRLVEEGVR